MLPRLCSTLARKSPFWQVAALWARAINSSSLPKRSPLLGKGCLPDDSPYTTGGIGLLGTKPSHAAIAHCDTLFMIGTSFPYMEFLPKPGSVRGVQLDVD